MRRIELYAGGLTGDSAIALEQLAKRGETADLAGRLPSTEAAVRDLKAAISAFDADVARAAQSASEKLAAALARTQGLADATVPLEDARLQLELIKTVYGERDPRYREGAAAYRKTAAAYSDDVETTPVIETGR